MRKNKSLTRDRLLAALHYDQNTGVFTWKIRSNSKVPIGMRAGKTLPPGYVQIRIDKVAYYAHRLAWLYVYGEWPDVIDHADLNKSNNRIANLRSSTQSNNKANCLKPITNTSGDKGIYQAPNGAWRARIVVNYKRIHLGTFQGRHLAKAAYAAAANKYFGEFSRS